MPGPTSPPDEEMSLHMQVEADQTAVSQDVGSRRSTRFLRAGLGFGALLLIAVSACTYHPLVSRASAKAPSLVPEVAFSPMIAHRPRGIRPADHPVNGLARPTIFHPAVRPGSRPAFFQGSGRSSFLPAFFRTSVVTQAGFTQAETDITDQSGLVEVLQEMGFEVWESSEMSSEDVEEWMTWPSSDGSSLVADVIARQEGGGADSDFQKLLDAKDRAIKFLKSARAAEKLAITEGRRADLNRMIEMVLMSDMEAISEEMGRMGVTGDTAVPSHLKVKEDTTLIRFAHVDERTCIGCTLCATTAPNTFFMEEQAGRARVFSQGTDRPDIVAEAINCCPVDCIGFVSLEDLVTLESEREGLYDYMPAQSISSASLGVPRDSEAWKVMNDRLPASRAVGPRVRQIPLDGEAIAFKWDEKRGRFVVWTDVDGWAQTVPFSDWIDKLNERFKINVVTDGDDSYTQAYDDPLSPSSWGNSVFEDEADPAVIKSVWGDEFGGSSAKVFDSIVDCLNANESGQVELASEGSSAEVLDCVVDALYGDEQPTPLKGSDVAGGSPSENVVLSDDDVSKALDALWSEDSYSVPEDEQDGSSQGTEAGSGTNALPTDAREAYGAAPVNPLDAFPNASSLGFPQARKSKLPWET